MTKVKAFLRLVYNYFESVKLKTNMIFLLSLMKTNKFKKIVFITQNTYIFIFYNFEIKNTFMIIYYFLIHHINYYKTND